MTQMGNDGFRRARSDHISKVNREERLDQRPGHTDEDLLVSMRVGKSGLVKGRREKG